MNIYIQLTEQFNVGRLRAILSSGQAVVLHRLAVMSKDGDWILREDDEAIGYVLDVLENRKAVYRFGAPLDCRWMAGGWSSHFEFRQGDLRVRTDFVTRPPRISAEELRRMWCEQEHRNPPFVGISELIALKKTNREKDYAVIGEMARMLPDVTERFLQSRSALDLLELASAHPDLSVELAQRRPALMEIEHGRDRLEAALDAEKRSLMRANERRLQAYLKAAEDWAAHWPTVGRMIEGKPLRQAHSILVREAAGRLPMDVEGAAG